LTPAQDFKCVGDVRGAGMMVGIDVVENGLTKRHAPAAAKYVREGLKARRVLVSTDGPHNSVIKIKPPLCFGKREADRLVRELKQVPPLPSSPLNSHLPPPPHTLTQTRTFSLQVCSSAVSLLY